MKYNFICAEIFIMLKGTASVLFRRNKTPYKSKTKYLRSKTILLSNCQLSAGTHVYKFEIQLPLECPSSCEKNYGRVEYELNVVMERSLLWDHVFRQPLTIIAYADLNLLRLNTVSFDAFGINCCMVKN